MNYEDVKNLIDNLSKVDFEELNLEFPDGVKMSMKKSSNISSGNVSVNNQSANNQSTNNQFVNNQPMNSQSVNNQSAKYDVTADILTNNNLNQEDNINIVSSPMVGTFYDSPSPDSKPFVKLGDKVKKGQVLCIIEAMKLMNEIESEYDGEIVEICSKNNGIVEYGMPLFKIK